MAFFEVQLDWHGASDKLSIFGFTLTVLIAAKVVVGIHLGSSHSRTRGRASSATKFVGRCSLAASTVSFILLNTPLVPTYGKRRALSKILVPTGACYCKAGRIGK